MMESEKYISEVLPQEKADQFAEILKAAISSYIENKDKYGIKEWLGNYLLENITGKTPEEIAVIRDSIINTVELHEKSIASMSEALKSGQSIEAWFQQEIDSEASIGSQAYELVDAHSALTSVSNQYAEPEEQDEVIDVEVISPEEWYDANWNKYKMKELVSETVYQAGDAAIRTTASDLYSKTLEYGLRTVLTDKELLSESVINGASTGLKAAVAGAMEVAEDRQIIPTADTTTESRSLIASLTIENFKVLHRVVKGEISLTDALSSIKNNGVATVASIVKHKITAVGQKIGATVGAVFGPVGVVVGNFVGGAVGKFAGTKVGSKIVETAKKVSTAAKSVVSHVRDFGRKAANKVKSIVGRLFS